MARRHKPHRGVVLLVVLTLLTLLIVVGLTFTVLSGQFRRAAEASASKERYDDEGQKLLDRAMYQLVRDTPGNARSNLKGHSLLRDLLGNDGVAGRVKSSSRALQGEFLEINFEPVDDAVQPFGNVFSPQAGYYNGCTLTILEPVYTFGSARVVRYSYDQSTRTGLITVEWPDGEGGQKVLPRPDVNFLVNGRPFNGTGSGYLDSTQSLGATIPVGSSRPGLPGFAAEVALLPNYNTYADLPGVRPALGGLDESWDAVDYQNMYLAMVPADLSQGIIPSFHRPELVNYWLKKFADDYLAPSGITDRTQQINVFRCALPEGLDGIVGVNPVTGLNDDPVDDSGNPVSPLVLREIINFKRKIFLRPLPEDHPNFVNREWFGRTIGLPDESSPSGEPLGQKLPQMVWDVDNDGDGMPDSIWLDIGLPLQTDASGRRYRPLVAILCEDLDGRLNVNAHGSQAQRFTWYYALNDILQPVPDSDAATAPAPFATTPLDVANPLHKVLLPRGLGVGPAEIFLGHVFGVDDFRRILTERYRHNVEVNRSAGGISDVDDVMSQIKNRGLPRDFDRMYSAYGTRPDVWGRGAIGLDYSGQPMAFYMGEAGETVGDPYEQVLNREAAGYTDAPFTAAELERVLRFHDLDATGLPNRLLYAGLGALGGNGSLYERNRRLVTTHSAHLPVINATVPARRRQEMALRRADQFTGSNSRSYSVLELYAKKLDDGLKPIEPDAVKREQLIQVQLYKIVPWEIWHGQRLNINRLLGNGRDDNGNNVVDESSEADAGEFVWPDLTPDTLNPGIPDAWSAIPFNYGNPWVNPVSGESYEPIRYNRYAPQIYARHLYCLMMMLTEVLGPGGFLFPSEESSLDDAYRRELTAHRIAQWAINVVDFRDADAIMTPFEYDVNPFNGWLDMDGDPSTNPDGVGSERRLTWGAEYPDLLLTEGTAFHDRRVKDTAFDDGSRQKRKPDPDDPGDPDLDQYGIPQGSLFLELYCTRNARLRDPDESPRRWPRENSQFPSELYDEFGNLDLGRMAPRARIPDTSPPQWYPRYPVWQIVISKPLDPRPADPADPRTGEDSPLERSQRLSPTGKPDSTSFNPVVGINATASYNMDLATSLQGNVPPIPLVNRLLPERYVWFAHQRPPTRSNPPMLMPGVEWIGGPEQGNTYWGRNSILNGRDNDLPQTSNLKLAPGSYAVVGPRALTRVGSGTDGISDGIPSPQSFIIAPDRTFHTINNDGSDTYSPLLNSPNPIRPTFGIICAADPPEGWSREIGLNVSEPLTWPTSFDLTPKYYPEPTNGDLYDDPDAPQYLFPDKPLDNESGRPLSPEADSLRVRFKYYQKLQHTHTTEDFRAVFLQRLANPLEPFHFTNNPYITVDWSTIDLTVFNGEDERKRSEFQSVGEVFDEFDDPEDDDKPNEDNSKYTYEVRFMTRQRGRATFPPMPLTPPSPPISTTFYATDLDYQIWSPESQRPSKTLEYTTNNYFKHNLVHTLGYLNGTMGAPLPASIVAAAPLYRGAPQQPFPWLTWNNRPFANPLELMQVPSSTPSRLLHEFEVHFAPPLGTNDPYDSAAANLQNFRGPFRHLLNFFHTSKTSSTPTGTTITQRGADFYRLFDYVETPSPFVGAEKWYDPLATANLADPYAMSFQPPYNNLSRFQDPGRVNINTIFDSRVWEGIAKGYPRMDPTSSEVDMYAPIFESRRGYKYVTSLLDLDSDYPTLFGNPFRSADSADLMPLDSLRKYEPVQATLLREDLLNSRTDGLFVPPGDPGVSPKPAYQNQDRNAFFRYLGLARLNNLVSNNSNVFAVWITVGYFEVEPNPQGLLPGVDSAHPDGFRLGPELGTDSGTVKRHRAFYIIDRSVPVAFEPGQNHNVDKAILLRRFIE